MAKVPDDYFKDITAQISQEDIIKAGYSIPKTINTLPKTLQINTLRGELKQVAVPVPINFSEGGMFTDQKERDSYERPMIADAPKQTTIEGVVQPAIESSTAPAVPLPLAQAEQLVPVKKSESTEITATDKQEDKSIVVTPTSDKVQLTSPISINPFSSAPMVGVEGACKKVCIGENEMIIARGPNNMYGRSGFYAGIFKHDRFGMYPSGPIKYNPHDVNDCVEGVYIDPIKNARSDQVIEHKSMEQVTSEAVKLIDSIEHTETHVEHTETYVEHPDVSSDDSRISKLERRIRDLEEILTQVLQAVKDQTEIIMNLQSRT